MPSKPGLIDLDAAARLALTRKTLKVKQEVIAGATGVTIGSISHMEVGRVPIAFEVLKGLCTVYRVNPAYILTGESPMFLKKGPENDYDSLAAEVVILKAKIDKIESVLSS